MEIKNKLSVKDRKYIAGFLDGRFNLSFTSVGKKRKKSRISIASRHLEILKMIQDNFGGNILSHWKNSYCLTGTKAVIAKLLTSVGPYIVLNRDKVDRFVKFANQASGHAHGITMEPVKYINHKNDESYVAGYLDCKMTLAVFKSKDKKGNINENGYAVHFSVQDKNDYVYNFFKKNKVIVQKVNFNLRGIDYERLSKVGSQAEPVLTLIKKNSRRDSKVFNLLKNSIKNPNKENYKEYLDYCKFELDETALSTNLNHEENRKEKIKKESAKSDEHLETRLKIDERERRSVFKKKSQKQEKKVKQKRRAFKKAEKELNKEIDILNKINSNKKVCKGTEELLDKSEFNLNRNSYDGLSMYSRKYYNEYKKENYHVYRETYYSKKMQNPLERLSASVHTSVSACLKGKKIHKNSSCFRFLGYTIHHLRSHLQKQFRDGMTWDNYGTHWHLDHIKPRCEFDFNKKVEFKRCWSLENLQPLTIQENLTKGGSYDYKEMEKHEKLLNKIK